MALVYKYMTYDAFLKTVMQNGIFLKVSNPAEFNDPFDCTGTAKGSWSRRLITECWDVFGSNWADAQECLKCGIEGRDFIGANHRIICFADKHRIEKTGREKLMWSHYAESCRGVRLCFEDESLGFKVESVKYRHKLPTLNFKSMKSDGNGHLKTPSKFYHDCLTVKDVCWNYECEKRAIFDAKDPRIIKDENGVEVVEIPRSSLIEIALGCEVEICEMLGKSLEATGLNDGQVFIMEREGYRFVKRRLDFTGLRPIICG